MTPGTKERLKWKAKVTEWVKRYAPAEIIGTLAAYLGSFLCYGLTKNEIASAYAAVAGENMGFYGTIVVRQVIIDRRLVKRKCEKYGLRGVSSTIISIVLEFGIAEALDTLIIRPATIGVGIRLLNRKIGVLVGKLAADGIFYLLAILGYEGRSRWFSRVTNARPFRK